MPFRVASLAVAFLLMAGSRPAATQTTTRVTGAAPRTANRAATRAAARAAEPGGPSFLCNPYVQRQSPPWLRLFAATYELDTLAGAVAEDSLDRQAFGLVARIALPDSVGTHGLRWDPEMLNTRHGAYQYEDHFYNLVVPGARAFRVEWDDARSKEDGFTSIQSSYDILLRRAHSWSFCVASAGPASPLVFRGGIQRDLRYKAKPLSTILWNKSLGKSDNDNRRYVGAPVFPILVPGAGFPVQRYSVFKPNEPMASEGNRSRWEVADEKAHAQLTRNHQESAMQFYAYDFVLTAGIHEEEVKLKVCTTNFWGAKKCRMVPHWVYRRTLVGEGRLTQWDDARVVQDDTTLMTGGTVTAMTLRFRAPAALVSVPKTRDMWRRAIQIVCGNPTGCGPSPDDLPSPVAAGQIGFEGHDAKARGEDACKALALSAGKDCASGDNPYVISTTSDSASNAYMTDGHAGVEVKETAAQRALKQSGRRGTIQTESQLETMCRASAVEDSLRVVNGPVIVGDPTPAYPDSLVDAYVADCLRGATVQGKGAPRGPTDSAALSVAPGAAPRTAPKAGAGLQPPAAPSTKTQAPAQHPNASGSNARSRRCYEFNGKMYCS